MIIRKYSSFMQSHLLTENLEAARNFLRKKILEEEKEKNPDLDFNLADLKNPQKRGRGGVLVNKLLAVDTMPEFMRLKEMLKDNQGWLFAFTTFLFRDDATFEELSEVLKRIREKSSEDTRQLKPADTYATIKPTSSDKRTGLEVLIDDLTAVEKMRLVLNWIRVLPGDFTVKNENLPDYGKTVPSFRRAAREATGRQKEQITEIALGFNELADDPEDRKSLLRLFATNCLRYRTLSQVISEAYIYIDACSKRTIQELLLMIDAANLRFGFMNGAEVILIKDDVIVFEVKSFQANKLINASTKHCIKDNYSLWESYVSGEGKYNKQYYIWDFNKSSADALSIIGVTVEPGFKIRAAHSKYDEDMKTKIYDYVNDVLDIDFKTYFLPMSDTEVDFKKRREVANKEIIKPGLDLSHVKQLIEDGADPNHGDGKPLENACKQENKELIEYLIQVGAKPEVGRPMRFVRSFDTMALLLKNGAKLEDRAIDSCVTDTRAVKFLLDEGMDPNTNNGVPVVSAIRNGAVESLKILLEAGAEVYPRIWRGLKIALAIGNQEIIDILYAHIMKKRQKIDMVSEEDIIEHIKVGNRYDELFPDFTEKQLKEYEDKIIQEFKDFVKKISTK